MVRVVADTNVFISALMFGGLPVPFSISRFSAWVMAGQPRVPVARSALSGTDGISPNASEAAAKHPEIRRLVLGQL